MLIDFRQPDCHILERVVSATGKYLGFLGIHYHKGNTCYVVGASNKETGEITLRHYNEKAGCVNTEAAKWAAEQYWEKDFRPILVKEAEAEERDEASADLTRWIDQANARYGHIGSRSVVPDVSKPN